MSTSSVSYGPAVAASEVPRVTKAAAANSRVQCGRCLNNMEITPALVRPHLKCTRCHRHLGLPKLIRHVCSYCGCHGEYGLDSSGRRIPCRHCGMRIPVPVQVAMPQHRRRRAAHRAPKHTPKGSSMVPLLVSLGVSVLGLLLCIKLITNL